MHYIETLIHIILHIDVYLALFFHHYGAWAYGILFLIIFLETGVVVTPFLPGDSLLFAAGALAGAQPDAANITTLIVLLTCAAILGDSSNYWIGRTAGHWLFKNKDSKIFRRHYLDRAHAFYQKYGGKTILLARFLPILRTFAPFVAGMATMRYLRFLCFSVTGSVLWIGLLSLAGFWFGTIPAVKNNFLLVILAIIILSLIPAGIELFKQIKHRQVSLKKNINSKND
jgi:membrane-associated protein